MALKTKRAKKLIEEKMGSIEEKISSIEPPRLHRKHRRSRIVMIGVPLAGLVALGAYWRARSKKDGVVHEESPTRLPFDPAMSSPREEVTSHQEGRTDMSSMREEISTQPDMPANPASWTQETTTRPAEQPLDRTHFAPGAIDDKAGVMDNRPLQADTAVDPPVTDFETLIGMEVKDVEGHDLGRVESVYYHEANGVPEWVGFTVGLLDQHEVLAPLEGAAIGEQHLWLAYPKDIVEKPPSVHGDFLNYEEEKSLYSYYHVRRMLAENQDETNSSDELLRKWQPSGSETPKRRSA